METKRFAGGQSREAGRSIEAIAKPRRRQERSESGEYANLPSAQPRDLEDLANDVGSSRRSHDETQRRRTKTGCDRTYVGRLVPS